MKLRFLTLLLLVIVSSCARLQSVSLTEVPKKREQIVKAEVSDWVIIGLKFQNDMVDEVSAKLKEQCPGGKITGILTHYDNYLYFFSLVYKRKIMAEGYCLKNSNDKIAHN